MGTDQSGTNQSQADSEQITGIEGDGMEGDQPDTSQQQGTAKQPLFDKARLDQILARYKKDFDGRWNGTEGEGRDKTDNPGNAGNSARPGKAERFKWQAVQHFQDTWDIDAPDFANMLEDALSKTGILLASRKNYPRKMIVEFAQHSPDEVRSMFRALFDESTDICKRIANFKDRADGLLRTHYDEGTHTFQTENSITTYLWLRYPDRHYIYKFSEAKAFAAALDSPLEFIAGHFESDIRNFYALYDAICAYLQRDGEIVDLLRSHVAATPGCYPDPQLRTLTFDVGFYIKQKKDAEKKTDASEETTDEEETEGNDSDSSLAADAETNVHRVDQTSSGRRYWWLVANPKYWSLQDLPVGGVRHYTLFNENGNKRRIFKNFEEAQAGDLVIGYESTPVKQIVALAKVKAPSDGEKILFEKTENLAAPIDYQQFKDYPELKSMEYLNNQMGSLFKLTKAEYDFIMDLVRESNPLPSHESNPPYTKADFLSEVYMNGEQYDRLAAVLRRKQNIILQGAPGVGKTFCAKRLAYSLMGERDEGRVQLIQFHQNYSYEDFMMGYRPKPEGDGFELRHGVFYEFCKKAENQPGKDFFFIIDEINRGNLSKIFGELLMLIEKDYRGTPVTLAYNGESFAVPRNVYLIGMMNTADRSLAMIDYALRRRFSFIDVEPTFGSEGFRAYQRSLGNATFDRLIEQVERLNDAIRTDPALGKGFCIGHSYFCGLHEPSECTAEWMEQVVDYDIVPMLEEYWFDDADKVEQWSETLHEVLR